LFNFDQTNLGLSGGCHGAAGLAEGAMHSIVPFVNSGVFEPADIKVMSDAYDKAMEDIHFFGRPNKIVLAMIATRIINLTRAGERDPHRLCERALAVCGFKPDRVG
jgi:hypothetical protein